MTVPSDLWPAPAKLNLFLHITARRADGYHDLQTVFQFIDFQDQLGFGIRQDGQVIHNSPLVDVPAERDLCVRAAQLLKQETACALGVDIYLQKNIPQGGGLGGGSSDAATTLVALNHLWDLGLSVPGLMELGAQLGADVPVFIYGQNAWAEGIGEKLHAVELPERWYVVIYPGVMVSTGQLFEDPELTRDARPIKIRDYFAGPTSNVFESIVRRKYPAVDQAIKWLSQQEQVESLATPRMTGTGSSVFAAFADETSARLVAEKTRQNCSEHWQVFVARSCEESPLAQKLKTTAGQK